MQRLSVAETIELLAWLRSARPDCERGRFGAAQYLSLYAPPSIRALPHGVLVELVQVSPSAREVGSESYVAELASLHSHHCCSDDFCAQLMLNQKARPARSREGGMGGSQKRWLAHSFDLSWDSRLVASCPLLPAHGQVLLFRKGRVSVNSNLVYADLKALVRDSDQPTRRTTEP